MPWFGWIVGACIVLLYVIHFFNVRREAKLVLSRGTKDAEPPTRGSS